MAAEKFREVKRFIDEYNPDKIWFLSVEQESFHFADPCSIKVCFSRIFLGESPSYIYFSNGESHMRIDYIKAVNVRKERQQDKFVISVVCGGDKTPTVRRVYNFIAEPKNVS